MAIWNLAVSVAILRALQLWTWLCYNWREKLRISYFAPVTTMTVGMPYYLQRHNPRRHPQTSTNSLLLLSVPNVWCVLTVCISASMYVCLWKIRFSIKQAITFGHTTIYLLQSPVSVEVACHGIHADRLQAVKTLMCSVQKHTFDVPLCLAFTF